MTSFSNVVKWRRTRNFVLPPVAERMRVGFIQLDYSVLATNTYDLSYADNEGDNLVIQSMTVDNSSNDAPVDIIIDKTLQFSRRVNAGEIRTFNVPAIDPSYVTFSSAGTGTGKIYLYNFPSFPDSQFVDLTLQGGTAPNFTQSNVTVTNVSAEFVVANSTRKYLLIQNNDPAGYIYVGFGAAASVTDLRIPPGGSYEVPGVATGQAIDLIGDIASNANVVIIQG